MKAARGMWLTNGPSRRALDQDAKAQGAGSCRLLCTYDARRGTRDLELFTGNSDSSLHLLHSTFLRPQCMQLLD